MTLTRVTLLRLLLSSIPPRNHNVARDFHIDTTISLGRSHPQIEAETLPDISESFDIEAVPSFLLLRVSRRFQSVSSIQAPPPLTSIYSGSL
jgi:hypothetical protein